MLLLAQVLMCIGRDCVCLFYTLLTCMRVGRCVRHSALWCVGLSCCWSCCPRWRCRCYRSLALCSGRYFLPPSLAERLELGLGARRVVVRVHGFKVQSGVPILSANPMSLSPRAGKVDNIYSAGTFSVFKRNTYLQDVRLFVCVGVGVARWSSDALRSRVTGECDDGAERNATHACCCKLI
jgi:hypothetical protein